MRRECAVAAPVINDAEARSIADSRELAEAELLRVGGRPIDARRRWAMLRELGAVVRRDTRQELVVHRWVGRLHRVCQLDITRRSPSSPGICATCGVRIMNRIASGPVWTSRSITLTVCSNGG